ncbi:MAG: Gfo/Idh/MocA family oxidoreductase [Bryobacterales bacterium]|nr:Gfo/Idh/MocA family oxidoreductase [Bryobacterales bacterium]
MTTRRTFILAAAGSAAPAFLSGASVNERLTVGMMGFRGRGRGLLNGFADMPDVTVKTICDVDQRLFDRSVAEVSDRQGRAPGVESDFRRILDDPDIDIVVMGTPTHWHAIPTVLACQAGKHVYVEKPAGHNIAEGRAMLDAARKHDRVVQVGIQSRSGTNYEEACEYIRSGVLGKVAFAKGWESARQRGIGYPPDEPVPDGVDYEMWLGPAPKRPFNRNRFHGSWRWFFDYGAGDLGNDGVHRVDYARRGLAAGIEAMGRTLPDWPTAVSAAGGKLFFDDAQEWPDTLVVTWDYPGATLMYEMRNWQPNPIDGEAEGAAVYGENGYVVIGNGSWRAFDEHHRIVARGASSKNDDDARHKRDMLNAIRDGGRPACDIEIGHCASGLVHLGNIAWRTDRKLRFDPETETFGDDEANRMLGRKYRKPWILPDV